MPYRIPTTHQRPPPINSEIAGPGDSRRPGMIVVDANVIAYRFITGEKTDLATRVQEKDSEWIVPHLWRHEFLNVLATVTRAGILDTAEACTIWRGVVKALANQEHEVLYEKALCCALDFQVSAYDAQYITLAHMLNTLCITEDSRLRKAFPDTAISMRTFLD
jgi:predicted nucleic acid-binding protein